MSYVDVLQEADIKFGKELWQSLRASPAFPMQGMFWLLEPRTGEWQLIIASSKVDEIGTRDAYIELADVTRSISANSTQLLKIELISPRQPFYRALRSVFGKTASVEGARLGNTQLEGMFINDAYLYEVR